MPFTVWDGLKVGQAQIGFQAAVLHLDISLAKEANGLDLVLYFWVASTSVFGPIDLGLV